MSKPSPSSYPAYFKRYVDQVAEDDLQAAFENQLPEIKQFLATITEEKSAYAYDTGKWTLKEVLQHIIDAEKGYSITGRFALQERNPLRYPALTRTAMPTIQIQTGVPGRNW